MANNQRVRQAPGRSSPFVTLNPALQIANRAPTVHDMYEQGTVWIYPAANAVWQLTSFAAGEAIWTFLVSAAGSIDTLTGNVGGPIMPIGGNLDILVEPGLGMEFVGTPGTLTLSGVWDVAAGGTGGTSFTPYTLLAGGTAPTSPFQSLAGTGTSGQVLTSNGAAALPTFQAAPASSISISGNSGGALTGNAFTFTGGSTGLLFSGSGTTETVTGTLIVANGGTGDTSHTAYAVLTGGTTSTGNVQSVASVGTSGQVLTSNGAGALPSFQAAPASSISISGNSGGAQTASAFTLTGGTSGGTFAGASDTFTLAFTELNLPATTDDTHGVINLNGTPFMHGFDAANGSAFLGYNAGSFTNTGNSVIGIGTQAASSFFNSSSAVAIGSFASSQSGQSGSEYSGSVAVGHQALANLGTLPGALNSNAVAIGFRAGWLATNGGCQNSTAVGAEALTNGGTQVIAIGYLAGSSLNGSESYNIYIGNNGVAAEGNVIRIGVQGTGPGQQNVCAIAGIFGATVGAGSGVPVVVDNTGLLGTVVSSARYKQDIEPMGSYSASVYDLQPVRFAYKKDPSTRSSGLIAEQVAEVMPSLVVYDQDGNPETVKYQDIPVLLLNEIKLLRQRITALESKQ